MKTKPLPSCWFCSKVVRLPALILLPYNTALDGTDNLHPNYKASVWRYAHKDCIVADVASETALWSMMPMTYVGWIQFTIRMDDAKGAWFLFEMTNWRFVLDCVQEDYLQALNEYTNPVPAKKVARKPLARKKRPR
jgi:hypothetical protein